MSKTYKLKADHLGLTPEIETSIDQIYAQIVSLVKSKGKSFAVTDIFNVISSAIVAVNSFFTGTDVETKITYVGEIVQQVVNDLSNDGIIPHTVGYMIKFIPIKMIVEFVMKFFKQPPKLPEGPPHEVLKKLSINHHTGVEHDE